MGDIFAKLMLVVLICVFGALVALAALLIAGLG